MENYTTVNQTKKIKKRATVKFSEDCKFEDQSQEQTKKVAISSSKQTFNSKNKFRKVLKSPKSLKTTFHKNINTQTERIPGHLFRKSDSDLRQTMEDLQPRAATFFKIGFNSQDKKIKEKKLFHQFYNIPLSQMKGTMSYGELWSNKDKANFLRENKIHINKVKFIEKMNNFKKQNTQQLKLLRKNMQDRNWIQTFKSFDSLPFSSGKTIRSHANQNTSQNLSKKQLLKSFCNLRKDILQLHKRNDFEKLDVMFKDLQNCNQNLSKMERKYIEKFIQM